MKTLAKLDILTLGRPILMPALLAIALLACRSEGELEQGLRVNDTNPAGDTQPTGPLTAAALYFDSGDLQGSGGEYSYIFTKEGEFPYYCRYHGTAAGTGMAGMIRVRQKEGLIKRHTIEITGLQYPDLDIKIGDTVLWRNTSGMTHTAQSVYHEDSELAP